MLSDLISALVEFKGTVEGRLSLTSKLLYASGGITCALGAARWPQ